MSKTHVIYNQIGVFAGPAPSTGYHFLDYSGQLTNNDNPDGSFNLVFPLNRIIQTSYSWNYPRIDIKSLGYFGKIDNPILSPVTVNLGISYYLMGLINEARLGFNFNRPNGYVSNGFPIYGTGYVCPISGFLDRTYNRTQETELNWPLTYRDSRNIFVATEKNFDDLNDRNNNITYKSDEVDVWAFGDCYITDYRTSCSVGRIPEASINFNCFNIQYYNNGSGQNIPSVNPKNFTVYSGIKYNLPNTFQGNGNPSVLIPQNITIDIDNRGSEQFLGDDFSNTGTIDNFLLEDNSFLLLLLDNPTLLPIDLQDIKIQGYSIDFSLNREPLNNLGYKLPMDLRINPPIPVNLNFNVIVGSNATGSLTQYIPEDREYNITIKLNYRNNEAYNGSAIIYKFIKAKFNGISIQDSINEKRIANFSFLSEMNPTRMDKGFFWSGQLGIPVTNALSGDFLSTGTNQIDSLLYEDFTPILLISGIEAPLY